MKEQIYTAADGAKISYYIAGEGEALLCVHGSGKDKGIWEEYGWLKELQKHYKVIAMDIRGFGKSTVFHEEKDYELNRILDDIRGIMKECNVSSFRYFGHSYGAIIGYQAVKAGLPIIRAVGASGSIGAEFFKELCPKEHEEYEMLQAAKDNHTLESLTEYSEEDMEFIKEEDMKKFSAMFGAWSKWDPVEIEALEGKTSIYAGTLDFNKEMIDNTTIRHDLFLEHGIDTICFEGLNHNDLVAKPEVCMPWVLEHLR